MSQEPNHELFYLCCAKALSDLYENFPKQVDININLFVGVDTKNASDIPDTDTEKIYIAKQTIDWLIAEKYVRFDGQYGKYVNENGNSFSYVFKETSLPHKTLHVLSKQVDLYTTDGNQKLAVWLKQALAEEDNQKIQTTVERILVELIKAN